MDWVALWGFLRCSPIDTEMPVQLFFLSFSTIAQISATAKQKTTKDQKVDYYKFGSTYDISVLVFRESLSGCFIWGVNFFSSSIMIILHNVPVKSYLLLKHFVSHNVPTKSSPLFKNIISHKSYLFFECIISREVPMKNVMFSLSIYFWQHTKDRKY